MAASLPTLMMLMTVIEHGLLIFTANATGIIVVISNLTSMTISTSVTLDSSADSVCPGDTVVFTCATDTGELIWAVGDSKAFFNNISMPMDDSFPTFHLKLISQNGKEFISTATIDNVALDHNGTAISCSGSVFPQSTTTNTTATKTVIVAGIIIITACKIFILFIV